MTMEYKGYVAGPIEFDDEAGVLSGVVVGLRDVIHFTGRTADELAQSFRDSIDAYLEFCVELGEEPEKPYSGKLLLRVAPSLHRKAAIKAAAEGVSLNSWVARQIEAA